jgi:16S rRNA (cytosine1402-N4)-methyltransferase
MNALKGKVLGDHRMKSASFEIRHKPVLPAATIAALRPQLGHIVVDCTLGLGGHSRLLLERITPGGRLIATDFDPANIERARQALTVVTNGNFTLHHSNFAALPALLASEGIEQVDAILADLGVASPQIDDPARGFSYRKPGPLDMRMDPGRSESAAQLLARLSERDLRNALLELGDETDAPQIAAAIVSRRKLRPILTTEDLTAIVCEARDFTLARAAGAKLHPAARTFQALRILVNRETQNLDRLLAVAPTLLRPGGRIAIISFHSGEDRRVKQSFRDHLRAGIYGEISPDPITASEAEQRENPRSRSAKLRWAERIN